MKLTSHLLMVVAWLLFYRISRRVKVKFSFSLIFCHLYGLTSSKSDIIFLRLRFRCFDLDFVLTVRVVHQLGEKQR